jgi:hypothetical protein
VARYLSEIAELKTQIEVLKINVQHLREEGCHKDQMVREQYQTIEDLKRSNRQL